MALDSCLLDVVMVYAPHSQKLVEEKEFLEQIVPFIGDLRIKWLC